jgi:hypothetical protein
VLLCSAALVELALASEPFACVLLAAVASGVEAEPAGTVAVRDSSAAGVPGALLVWLVTGGVVWAATAALGSFDWLSAFVVSWPAGAEIAFVVSVAPCAAAPVAAPVVLAAIPGLLPLLEELSHVAATSFTSETVMLFCMEDCAEVLPDMLLLALDCEELASGVPVTCTLCPTKPASWLSLPLSL